MANWDLSAKDGRASVSFSKAQQEAFENVLETIAPATISRLKNVTESIRKNSYDLWPVAHKKSKGSKEKHFVRLRMGTKSSIFANVGNSASYAYYIKTGEPIQPLSLMTRTGKRVSQFLIFSPGMKKKTVNELATALADDLAKSAVSDRPVTRFKALFKGSRELL